MVDSGEEPKGRGSKSVLAALMCFSVGTTALWLWLDHRPAAWDDAWYLANSLVMFDALAEGGPLGYVKRFLTILGTKPPLITVLPTPIYLILGRNPRWALGVNLLFIPILLASVYLIARSCWSARAGLIASYIVATMPLLYGLAHWYLAEFVLTSFVCVGVHLLMKSDHLENPYIALFIGFIWGLGLLLKITFPLYLVLPSSYVLIKYLFRRQVGTPAGSGARPPKIKTLLILFLPAVLVPLPWYIINFRRTYDLAMRAGFSHEADVYGTGPAFTWAAIKTYLIHLASAGPSCYYVLLAVLLLAGIALTGKLGLFRSRFRENSGVLLGLWALPFLVFLFGRNKNIRYVAPILPVFAVLLACGLDFIFEQPVRWRKALLGFVLAFPLVGLLQTSFGVFGSWRRAINRFEFVTPAMDYARRYDGRAWGLDDILKALYGSSKFNAGEKKTLMLGTDREYLNANNLELSAVEARMPLEPNSSAYQTDLDKLLAQADSTPFFVYEEHGEQESSEYNIQRAGLVRHVRESGRFVEIPYGRPLPSGGIPHLYKSLSTRTFVQQGALLTAGLDQVTSCNVVFDNTIQLTGLSIVQSENLFEVKYRWRCLAPVSREYWCFTHILDENGAVLFFLDHAILSGDPPMRSWREGDIALEDLRIPLAGVQPQKKLRLRLGLFDQPTGDRLRVSSFASQDAFSFLPADQGTAIVVVQNAHDVPSTQAVHSGQKSQPVGRRR